MAEASTIISSRPSRVIVVLTRQRAIKAVKQQIQAKGLKLTRILHRVIAAQGQEYLIEHRRQPIEEAAEMVRGSPELRKFYEREQRERQRWLEQFTEPRITRASAERMSCTNRRGEMIVGYAREHKWAGP
jgi:hypothetical protein